MSEEIKKETGMLNASVAPENFDWEAFEGSGVYDSADKDEIRKAYDQTLSKIVEGEVVEGEVTAIKFSNFIVF